MRKFLIWLACMILGLYGIMILALTGHGVVALLLSPLWVVWVFWTRGWLALRVLCAAGAAWRGE